MRKAGGIAAVLVVAGVAGACGGGGNGIASDSPSQILTAAINAMKSANSVRLTGGGSAGSNNHFSVNVQSFKNGDINGTVTENGQTYDFIEVGTMAYIKAGPSIWESQGVSSSQAASLASKWISEPTSQAGLGSDFTISALASSMARDGQGVKAGTTGTVNGQSAISIKSSKGGILWVATSGPAYPLEVIGTGSSSGGTGTIYLTGWNQGSLPSAPPNAVPLSSFTNPTGTTGSTGTTGTTGSTGTTGTTGNTGTGSTGSTGTTGATGTTGNTGSGNT